MSEKSGLGLTQEEIAVVEEFRRKLIDALCKYDENFQSDLYLIRWLRARDMDLAKSEVMLRNSLEWREKNNMDQILNVIFEESFLQAYHYNIDGYDQEGRPLCYMPAGKWDMVKIVRDDKIEEYTQYINQYFEKIVDAIRKSPPNKDNQLPQTQFTLIVDFDQFSYSQLINFKVIQTMLRMGQIYEAHYPEILFSAFFVNCDWIFTLFFSFLKPILASKTIGKIQIFGTNRAEYEEAILKLIKPDQLKIVLGTNANETAEQE